jgi:hypothetical protein
LAGRAWLPMPPTLRYRRPLHGLPMTVKEQFYVAV